MTKFVELNGAHTTAFLRRKEEIDRYKSAIRAAVEMVVRGWRIPEDRVFFYRPSQPQAGAPADGPIASLDEAMVEVTEQQVEVGLALVLGGAMHPGLAMPDGTTPPAVDTCDISIRLVAQMASAEGGMTISAKDVCSKTLGSDPQADIVGFCEDLFDKLKSSIAAGKKLPKIGARPLEGSR